MPELPEVEIVRRVLEQKTLHQKITALEILTEKSFQGNSADVLQQTITAFTRLGKQLSIHLSNHKILLIHLKMTGQLVLQSSTRLVMGHPTKDMDTSSLPDRSTRLIFTFSNQSRLYFNDQRKFGWVKVTTPDEIKKLQAKVGVDILDSRFSLSYFHSHLQTTHRPIKIVLLDQERFAGIGNIYANDALWLAKIDPHTPAALITATRLSALHQAVIDIINESLLHGGSTTRDKKYLTPTGDSGSHQFHFRVYDRAGEPCLRCGTLIKRLSLGGRGTFFCPHCQH